MSSTKFKVKVGGLRLGDSTPAWTSPSPNPGSLQPLTTSNATPTPPSTLALSSAASADFSFSLPTATPSGLVGSKRKAPQDVPGVLNITPEPPPKRQQSESVGAVSTGTMKFRVKASSLALASIPSMQAAPTAGLASMPSLTSAPSLPGSILNPQGRAAPQQAGLAAVPQPQSKLNRSNNTTGMKQPGARIQVKATTEAKAQAAHAKKQEKEAQIRDQEHQNQLQAVMNQAFGTKFKLKVKPSSATKPTPAVAAPAQPLGPAPGMVPLPAANGTSESHQPSATRFRVKVSLNRAAPGPTEPFAAPTTVSSAPSALAYIPQLTPAHTDFLPYSSPVPAAHGPPIAARGPPMSVRGPPVAARGRGRGRFGLGADGLSVSRPLARPAVPKRPKLDDEEYDPTADMQSLQTHQHLQLQPSNRFSARPTRPEPAGRGLQVFMTKVLENLAKKDLNNIFKAPVTDEIAANYSAVIKNPMCFDVMRSRLSQGLYATWEAFEGDLNLIFDNALLYNGAGSFVAHHALYLREVSQKYLDLAKQGETNFRGTANPITRKFQNEWMRTHPKSGSMPMSTPDRPRPPPQARVAPNALPDPGPLAMPGRPVVDRKPRVVPPLGGPVLVRQRHSSVAAGGGRVHRSGLQAFGSELDGVGRAARAMHRRGAGRGVQVLRSMKATDPDARRMTAVYVRRNDTEDLRDTYHVPVPTSFPVATWRGLAGGANAEGSDFAVGNFALRPCWPGALYKTFAEAVQAIQAKAGYKGEALPQTAYSRSMARFVRRCHPALRNLVVSQRLVGCVVVEGLPEPAPPQLPTPPPAASARASSDGQQSSQAQAPGQSKELVANAVSLLQQYKKDGVPLNLAVSGGSAQQARSPSPEMAAAALMMLSGHSPPRRAPSAVASKPVLHLTTGGAGTVVAEQQVVSAAPSAVAPDPISLTEEESASPLPDLPPASPST